MPIIDITSYAARLVKPNYKGNKLKRTDNPNKPGWFEIRQEMGVHVLGEFPETLLSRKRPNDHEVWHTWKRQNFSPITKGPINTAIVNERRTLAESNYTVTFAPNDDDTPEYVTADNFHGKDLAEWLFGQPHLISKYDPNGLIVPMPVRFDPDLTGETNKVDVELFVIDSAQIMDVNHMFVAWKSYEHSVITEGGQDHEGSIYWVIDGEFYYTITQVSISTNEYRIDEYYRHGTGSPMFAFLPAKEEKRKDKVLRRSHMEEYAPWANDELLAYADLKISEALHVHPVAIEKPRDCNYVNVHDGYSCSGGVLTYKDSGEVFTDHVCPRCNGKGVMPAIQPGESIVREEIVSENDPAYLSKDIPALEYVERPIEQLQFGKELVEWRAEQAEKAINRKRVDTNQSGVAKIEDRHDEESAIESIGRQWFKTLERVLYFIVQLRNPVDYASKKPVVTPATDYNLKTETDLLDRLRMVKEAGAPASVYLASVREYTERAYANNKITKLKIEIALFVDYLQIHDLEEQNLTLANNSAELYDLVLSLNVNQIIDEILEAQPAAVDWSPIRWMTEINKRVDVIVEERMPEGVDAEGGALIGVDGVITPEAIDLEAEAKANIRGSVGGVTGIIQIATAVAQGTITESSAEAILVRIYGITSEEAKAMIEVPLQQAKQDLNADQ